METRPTTGKVKESLFSIIQFDIEGRRVLDLFAGTGQLGIEALSRGPTPSGSSRNTWPSASWPTGPASGRGTPCPTCAAAKSSIWSFWTRPTPPACWSRR